MKYYKERYLKTWTKEELIEHILCLQHNLKCEEEGNDHLYKTVTAVMHKDPAFAKAVSEVLEVWNSSFGHRYIDDRKANKPTGGFSEFAERVKDIIHRDEDISNSADEYLCDMIDELVEEMTEKKQC